MPLNQPLIENELSVTAFLVLYLWFSYLYYYIHVHYFPSPVGGAKNMLTASLVEKLDFPSPLPKMECSVYDTNLYPVVRLQMPKLRQQVLPLRVRIDLNK